MNPYTSKFTNETLLLKTPHESLVEDIQAIYDEPTRQILFMIHRQQESTFADKRWIMVVDFDTMQAIEKKQVTTIDNFQAWKLFIL
jgi:hypothetical protein